MLLNAFTYLLATFNFIFLGLLGVWYYMFTEFPSAMVDDMKKTEAGTKIFDQMWGGQELGLRAIAGSYMFTAMAIPAIITAPRWARVPPAFAFAFHMMWNMTYHEARLIEPTPYPPENIAIHALMSLGMLLLVALPAPKKYVFKEAKNKL